MIPPPVPAEEITSDDVGALLQRMNQLKSELRAAHAELDPLDAELEQARREVQDRVTPLRRQMSKLQTEVMDLEDQIRSLDNATDAGKVSGPPPPPPPPPPPLPSPPRAQMPGDVAVAKDQLLEHAFRVLDHTGSDEDSDLIGKIQEMVKDPSVTFGAMLERLDWGPLWERRSSRETLAVQYGRLGGWEKALAGQLTAVQQKRANLQQDDRYEQWQRRQQGPAAWEAYLVNEQKPFQAAIADLAAQKAELETELSRRRRQGQAP